jgi:energy-converting hydrogenase Eha subunit F
MFLNGWTNVKMKLNLPKLKNKFWNRENFRELDSWALVLSGFVSLYLPHRFPLRKLRPRPVSGSQCKSNQTYVPALYVGVDPSIYSGATLNRGIAQFLQAYGSVTPRIIHGNSRSCRPNYSQIVPKSEPVLSDLLASPLKKDEECNVMT